MFTNKPTTIACYTFECRLQLSKIKCGLTIFCHAGIRRLPAVCACGKTLEELNLDRYEVTHCDPLHDFKNVIVHLFDELPSQINDADIRKEISHFCTTSMGMCCLYIIECPQ